MTAVGCSVQNALLLLLSSDRTKRSSRVGVGGDSLAILTPLQLEDVHFWQRQ